MKLVSTMMRETTISADRLRELIDHYDRVAQQRRASIASPAASASKIELSADRSQLALAVDRARRYRQMLAATPEGMMPPLQQKLSAAEKAFKELPESATKNSRGDALACIAGLQVKISDLAR